MLGCDISALLPLHKKKQINLNRSSEGTWSMLSSSVLLAFKFIEIWLLYRRLIEAQKGLSQKDMEIQK
jgi:hypothetical protein